MNDLAELLAEHVIDPDPTTPYQCACGFLLEFDYNRDTHRAHVAQMVLESDWLRGVKADVWKEAVQALAWCVDQDESVESAITYALTNIPYSRSDAEDGGR